MLRITLYALIGLFLMSCGAEKEATNRDGAKKQPVKKERIASLNGTITEILVGFGMEDQIVGVDVTSNYPASINKLPKVGHTRNLQAEGVLSLSPTIIIGKEGELKPELLDKLKSAGAKVLLFKQEYSVEGSKRLIDEIAAALGKQKEAEKLISQLESDIETVPALESKPKVLFIYARGAGSLMVAGKNTQMQSFIELAGAENAISGFEDFKPLTPEALLEANPDAILMFSSGLESLEGQNGLMKVPGIADTNAGKNGKFIALDGALISGFGPRLGKALKEFNKALNAEKVQ